MFGLTSIVIAAASVIEGNRIREEMISKLPIEEQEKIREKDRKDYEENLKHRRALEVAEAGRTRNFWGK